MADKVELPAAVPFPERPSNVEIVLPLVSSFVATEPTCPDKRGKTKKKNGNKGEIQEH
uniref:Uncharacterized protein n=1 Tax=Rhizophora mucronata TaxID=61149 RepID=A0A2P2M7M0_RHIMU